jgi:hypothetical protein
MILLYSNDGPLRKPFMLLSMIQGITIGPLVRYLDVRKTNKKESINEELHSRVS